MIRKTLAVLATVGAVGAAAVIRSGSGWKPAASADRVSHSVWRLQVP